MKSAINHPTNHRKRKELRHKMARRLVMLFMPLMIVPIATSVSLSAEGGKNKTTASKTKTEHIMKLGFMTQSLQMYQQMDLARTGLGFDVFEKAIVGYLNLKDKNMLSQKGLLTIVDFQKSSKQKRLWVIDLKNKKILYHTYVAHGRGSGQEYAEHFSNQENSYMSSLGFYVTKNTYQGKHGLSLKLNGVDQNFNTEAEKRCVVVHGADYVSEAFIKSRGRLGLSHGCPALPVAQTPEIVNAIKGGTAMYLHFPDKNYQSAYLDADTAARRFYQDNKGL